MTRFRDYFEDYARGYDAFDARRISSFAHCPLLTVVDGAPTTHTTPEMIESFFSDLLQWFRGVDHEFAGVHGLDATMLGDRCAFANVTWRSRRRGGKPDLIWPTAYHLVRPGDDWRILSITLRYATPREAR